MKKLLSILFVFCIVFSAYSQTKYNISIGQLKGVSIGSPTVDDVLKWDGTKWVNGPPGAALLNPMTTPGDIIVGGTGGAPTRLAKGTTNQVLTVDASGSVLWVSGASSSGAYASSSSSGTTGSTMNSNIPLYIFNGSSPATWTLPLLSGVSGTRSIHIKNMGTADLTLQRNATDQIWKDAAVTSYTLAPGKSVAFNNVGGYWATFFEGVGGSGSGTVNTGTSGRIAYYATTGTGVSETASSLTWDNTNGKMAFNGQTTTGQLNLKPASGAIGLFIRNTTDADIALLINSAAANQHIFYGNGNASLALTTGILSVGGWAPAGAKMAVSGASDRTTGAYFKGYTDADAAFVVNNAASTQNQHLFYSNGNATIANNGGTVKVNGIFQLIEQAAPSTPATGFGTVYINSTDSKLHFISDGGTDYDLTATGGGGVTNLALGTATSTTQPITNSNGTGFTLPSATATTAGLMPASLFQQSQQSVYFRNALLYDTLLRAVNDSVFLLKGIEVYPASTKIGITKSVSDTTIRYGIDINQSDLSLGSIGGSLGIAQINATGTPSATTFLRGDGSWATPAGGSESAMFTKTQAYVYPITGTAGLSSTGFYTSFQVAGTPASRSQANTSALASLPRIAYTTAGTAAAEKAAFKTAHLQFWRGNATGLGGYDAVVRFAFPTLSTDRQVFAGMVATTSGINGNVNPSSLTNSLLVAADATDVNFQIMYNDASGTATKVDTGIPLTTTDYYSLRITVASNGSSVDFSFKSSAGTSFTHTATTDIPANTVFQNVVVQNNSNASTQAVSMELIGIYVETPNL